MIRKRTALWLVLSTGVQAETALPIDAQFSINESHQTLQNNTREINQLIEEKRYQQMTQSNAEPGEISHQEALPMPALPEGTQCLSINGIYIQGITLLTSGDFDDLTKIPEQCISKEDANLLARELTHIYITKGYITTRIKFIEPNDEGELGLEVVEGFIESVESDDPELNGESIFPNMIGRPLNITSLDQALDQANRLASNNITIDILPGEQPGGSILKLYNKHEKPWHITTSLDNYGNKSTGKWQSNNTFSLDNPLGLSDSINLSVGSTVDNPQNRHGRSVSLFYSVPYGALTFSTFGSYAEYLYPIKLQTTSVEFESDSQQYGLRTEYVFHRNQNEINSLSTQLTYKQTNQYIEKQKLEISSPTFTVFELGLNHLHMLSAGMFNINFAIERGLPWLGADDSHDPNSLYDSEYTKTKISTFYSQYFSLFGDVYLFSNQLYAQYSRDRLPGAEWLSITGSNAVRGFKRNNLSADKGWYSQNTLSRTFMLGETTITPRFGFDVGRIQSDPQGWSSAMGMSFGINAKYHDFKLDVEASRGRLLSENSPIKEPKEIMVRFSYSF